MKKLRLDLESLDVVSFATGDEQEVEKGTVHGQNRTKQTDSYFTLGWHDSCYGMCNTHEYHTCYESGPTVGPSCDYFCTAQTVGCTDPAETEYCA